MVLETIIICFTVYCLLKPIINEVVRKMEMENDDRENDHLDRYFQDAENTQE